MDRYTLLEDIIILALFFVLIYALTYIFVHIPSLATYLSALFSNPVNRILTAILLAPLSIAFIAMGIRIVFTGVTGSGRIAIGFIFIVIGVAGILFSMYTLLQMLWSGLESFVEQFTYPSSS